MLGAIACLAIGSARPADARLSGFQHTTTTLSLSTTSTDPTTPVTLTATVTGETSAPTGTVGFANAGTYVGSATLSPISSTASQATFTATFTTGTYAIVASYTFHLPFLYSTSSSQSLVVAETEVKHPTTVTLTNSPSTLTADETASFTATVSETDGSTTPTGNVTFEDNGVLMGVVALDGSGKATLSNVGFTEGTHNVSASYEGDALDEPTNASGLSLSVGPQPGAVQTTITASASPSRFLAGTPVTLSAHVTQTGTPTGPLAGDLVTFSANGSLVGQAFLDGSGDASVDTSGWRSGDYDITASFVGDTFNAPSSATFSITVAGPLTVTAPSPTITYGDGIPSLTPSYRGFHSGDGPGSLATQPTCTTTATSASPAGTYPVTCSGGSDSEYDFSYVPGTLTIAKAVLTVKPNDATMLAGQVLPTLTASFSGFVNGQTLGTSGVTGTASCTTSATSTNPPGTYPITCSRGTLDAGNYDFSFSGTGTLTIAAAGQLTVTAPSPTIAEGDPIPTLTPTYSGFVNGDTPDSLDTQATCTTTATASSPPGTYPVTCSGAADVSYTFAYVVGTLTITPAGGCDDLNVHPSCEPLLASPAPDAGSTVQPGASMVIFYVDDSPIGTHANAPTAVLSNGESLPVTVTPVFLLRPYWYVDNDRWTWAWFQDMLTFSLPTQLQQGDYSILVTAHDAEGDYDQWSWPITVASSSDDDNGQGDEGDDQGGNDQGGDHGGNDHGGHGHHGDWPQDDD